LTSTTARRCGDGREISFATFDTGDIMSCARAPARKLGVFGLNEVGAVCGGSARAEVCVFTERN
jgi:hypothetical protein